MISTIQSKLFVNYSSSAAGTIVIVVEVHSKNEVDYISYCAKTSGKDPNPTSLPPAISK